MVGIWWRGWCDIIGDRRDEWEVEIEIEEDAVVDGGEPVKLELGGLCLKPLNESNFIVVEVGSLEDIEVPLTLLLMSWQVVNVTGNGGLP